MTDRRKRNTTFSVLLEQEILENMKVVGRPMAITTIFKFAYVQEEIKQTVTTKKKYIKNGEVISSRGRQVKSGKVTSSQVRSR